MNDIFSVHNSHTGIMLKICCEVETGGDGIKKLAHY